MSYGIPCFVCESELEPGMLFCINCGQDQRFKPIDTISEASLPVTADTYILAKNYPTNIKVPLAKHYQDTRYLQIIDAATYIWTSYPDNAYQFTDRAEIESVIAKLRRANELGPMQIIIRKGK